MNTNFKVIGLTRLGIKPKSTAPTEADALTTRPSELYFKHASPASWRSGNGIAIKTCDSWVGPIGHCDANGSPALRCFLRAVLQALSSGDGPLHSLAVTRCSVILRV